VTRARLPVFAGLASLVTRSAGAVARLPAGLRFALLFAAAIRVVGLTWGMPASDAWDVDGVAPRDFLPGLAETFTPGQYYTYPPLHLALLSVLTLPVTVLAVLRADSTAVSSVMHVITAPAYMTAMAMTARVLSVLMSLGIVIALAKIAAEIVPAEGESGERRRARVATAVGVVAAVNVSFTYYAHMSNLDVPYLFWASFAMLALVRAIARAEPRRLRHAAVLAACAVATKDQAYAMFLLAAPLLVLGWVLAGAGSRGAGGEEGARGEDAGRKDGAAGDAPRPARGSRRVAVEALIALAIAAGLVLLLDGALFNPSGFRARLGFLTGSASQDYATYSRDATGRLLVTLDAARAFKMHYPPVLAIFVAVGLVGALLGARGRGVRALLAASAPLAIALSFTVCFNMVARRVEERFTLPQMLMAAVYAGIGLEQLWSVSGGEAGAAGWLRWPVRAACVAILGLAAWDCAVLDANLLMEPRYTTEAFLAAHVKPGDGIEVHGLNVYLPRFPAGAKVTRVGPTAPEKRGPLPGVEEIEAPLMGIASRHPRFVVVSECYVWRYLERDLGGDTGRIVPTRQKDVAHDADATAFFQGLFHGRLGYHVVDEARVRSKTFPRRELHASVGCPVFTFERNGR